jgi:hypothetical protein
MYRHFGFQLFAVLLATAPVLLAIAKHKVLTSAAFALFLFAFCVAQPVRYDFVISIKDYDIIRFHQHPHHLFFIVCNYTVDKFLPALTLTCTLTAYGSV